MSATGSRRPRGTLSREQVLRAALAVADRDGVASELGVPGASLYRHASGRADLIAGLADVVLAGWEIPDPEPDPIRAFAAAQRSLREVLRPQSPAAVVASVSGVAELVPGGGRAGDATLVGAQVAGVRVTLTSGFVVIFGRFMDILHYP